MIREVASNELFTVLLVLGLMVIAATKLVAPKRFNDFIYIIGSYKYLKIYSRDQKFFDKFDALLFINLVLSVSVFSFMVYQVFGDEETLTVNVMFKLTVGIGVFILIKVLIERLLGSLFEIDKLIEIYLFQKISYKNYLGLLLLPINAVLIFNIKPSLTMIYCIVGFLLVLNSVGLMTLFKTHLNIIKNNLFYFILYLCALEIAPYIILYKVFITK